MAITVGYKYKDQNIVQCQECSLYLCGKCLDSSLDNYGKIKGVDWQARHPHPDDVDIEEMPGAWNLYNECSNKGKIFNWKWINE